MSGGRCTCILALMSVPEPVRVVVEIQHTTDTVEGRIAVGDGSSSHFYGWLELIDRLERAAVGPPRDDSGRAGP